MALPSPVLRFRATHKKSGAGCNPDSAPLFPGTGATDAAPVHSIKSHREAPAVAVDPETANVSKHVAPAQEGGLHRLPAKPMLTTGLSSVLNELF